MDQSVVNVLGAIVVALLFYFILWKPWKADSQATKRARQRLAGSSDPMVVKSKMRRLREEGARLDSFLLPEVRHLEKELPKVVRESTDSREPWQKSFLAQGAAVSHLTTKTVEFINNNGLASDKAFLWEAAVRTTDNVGEVLNMGPILANPQFLESVAAGLEEEFNVDFDEFLK